MYASQYGHISVVETLLGEGKVNAYQTGTHGTTTLCVTKRAHFCRGGVVTGGQGKIRQNITVIRGVYKNFET